MFVHSIHPSQILNTHNVVGTIRNTWVLATKKQTKFLFLGSLHFNGADSKQVDNLIRIQR